MNIISVERKFNEMGWKFPPLPSSKGIYKPCLTVGNFLFVSGHVSVDENGKCITGKVGTGISEDDAKIAARQCALAILNSIQHYLGSLEKLKRVVKILGMVNCEPDYDKQPLIMNGCSEVFLQLMGEENGVGVRSAVGMGSLPGNVTVEVEAMFELHA